MSVTTTPTTVSDAAPLTTSPTVTTRTIPLSSIRRDGGTQPRAELDHATVTAYRNLLERGTHLPPVEVVYDGTDYWLWDGFHRCEAASDLGFATITANIRQGTQRDAVILSLSANATHGLPRSNEDKRRAVAKALEIDPSWSDRKIATICEVSHPFVAKVRADLVASGNISRCDERKFERGGQVTTMDTGGIADANAARAEEDEQPDPRSSLPTAEHPWRPVIEFSADARLWINKMGRLVAALEPAEDGVTAYVFAEIHGRRTVFFAPDRSPRQAMRQAITKLEDATRHSRNWRLGIRPLYFPRFRSMVAPLGTPDRAWINAEGRLVAALSIVAPGDAWATAWAEVNGEEYFRRARGTSPRLAVHYAIRKLRRALKGRRFTPGVPPADDADEPYLSHDQALALVPGYNEMRAEHGLPPVTGEPEATDDPDAHSEGVEFAGPVADADAVTAVIFRLAKGIATFRQLMADTKLAPRALADALRQLTEQGVVQRNGGIYRRTPRDVPDAQPPGIEYVMSSVSTVLMDGPCNVHELRRRLGYHNLSGPKRHAAMDELRIVLRQLQDTGRIVEENQRYMLVEADDATERDPAHTSSRRSTVLPTARANTDRAPDQAIPDVVKDFIIDVVRERGESRPLYRGEIRRHLGWRGKTAAFDEAFALLLEKGTLVEYTYGGRRAYHFPGLPEPRDFSPRRWVNADNRLVARLTWDGFAQGSWTATVWAETQDGELHTGAFTDPLPREAMREAISALREALTGESGYRPHTLGLPLDQEGDVPADETAPATHYPGGAAYCAHCETVSDNRQRHTLGPDEADSPVTHTQRYNIDPAGGDVTIRTLAPMSKFVTSRESVFTISPQHFERHITNTLAHGHTILSVTQAPPGDESLPDIPPHSVHFSSESDEWYTPADVLARVIRVLGSIELDPCSNSHEAPNVPAMRHFTRADDGLAQEWRANTMFMNPPYGRGIDAWIEKLCDAFEAGDIQAAIALVPARTDTQWFQRLRDYPRCFVTGRLAFNSPDGRKGSSPFPSALVYLGPNPAEFAHAFASLGDIFIRWEPQTAGISVYIPQDADTE